MGNSTQLLDIISSSQSAKEVTANALFDAGSMATLFGRRASTTSALTWGYYGGTLGVSGVLTSVANGTLTLAASTTNYVESTTAGVVSSNTSAFTVGRIQLYTIITGVSSVTSYTDQRAYGFSAASGAAVSSVSVVSANGLGGTVATPTTTPAITLSTSITGVLKGNGTAISAAAAGTDYQVPITLTTTGSSGAATFIAGTLNIPSYAGGGSGTVTSASVVSANGFAGTVANPTTTPEITLTTSITGVLKGNGTAISAAAAGTDYLAPPSGSALLKANSGSALQNAVANTDYLTPPLGTSLIKAGAGGALANASSGTDYTVGTASLGSGILRSTTATGNISIAIAGTDFQAPITFTTTGTSGVATFSAGTLNIPNYSGLLLSGGTMTGGIVLAAGTTSLSPLQFTSGTNLTTATAGTIEYDGSVFYAGVAASTRAGVRAEQSVQLNTAYPLTSQTAAQKAFNASTNGAVTLPVGCYEFECRFALTALSATSGSFGFAMAGSATYTQQWTAAASKAATLATAATWQMSYNVAANTTLATASTSTVGTAIIRGRLNVTATGTVIPQISLTQLATPSVSAGSFFRVNSVSASNGATNILVGNWS
jgi:hypothetical protein